MSRLFLAGDCTWSNHGNYMLWQFNLQPGKISIINSSSSCFAAHSLSFLSSFFHIFTSIEGEVLAVGACTSEPQQQPKLRPRFVEQSEREAVASHRLAGQRGHSSPRIPPVVSYRPQFVSQSALRLLRKCSLSAGSLRFPPNVWFQQLLKQCWGYKSGQNNIGGNEGTQWEHALSGHLQGI